MQKVLLVIPNSRWCGKREWQILPYAAVILSSLLKDHFAFSVLDANGQNLSEQNCLEKITQLSPSIVMVSGGSSEYFRQIHRTFAIARQACPNATTILGGVYPTVLGEEALKDRNIDYIFQGCRVTRSLPRVFPN